VADSAGDAPRVGADSFVEVVCPLLVISEPPADRSAENGGDTRADPGSRQVSLAEHLRPDSANRCAASHPPGPLSLVQQRLVCLGAGHVDCPRLVRALGSGRGGSGRLARPTATRGGSAVPAGVTSTTGRASQPPITVSSGAPAPGEADSRVDPPTSTLVAAAILTAPAAPVRHAAVAPPPVVPVAPVVRSTRRSGARPARSRPGPIVLAVGILVVALVVAFAFTSLRGGLSLPGALPSLGTVSPSPSPSQLLSPSPTPAPSPTPTASPTPVPSPTSSPSPAPTSSGTPRPSVPPAFVGLKPCPDAPDCYLYRVRSGDNLTRIAQRFGVAASAIRRLNPEITDPSLIHVGDVIRIPLPTG
jgi:LysM repeat protein